MEIQPSKAEIGRKQDDRFADGFADLKLVLIWCTQFRNKK